MSRLALVLLTLTTACATVQPRPEPDYGSEGSGSPGPRGVSLLSMLEGQAMAPVGSPSWMGQAYSLTLNAPSGANGIKLTDGARIDFGSGSDDYLYSNGSVVIAANGFTALGTLTSGGSLTSLSGSGTNAVSIGTNGARIDFGGGTSDYASSDGTTVTFAGPIHSAATQTVGSITLAAGTGTATVISGAKCVCTDTTANVSVKCAVSGTTLTATGTTTDVIAYLCI